MPKPVRSIGRLRPIEKSGEAPEGVESKYEVVSVGFLRFDAHGMPNMVQRYAILKNGVRFVENQAGGHLFVHRRGADEFAAKLESER